MKWKLGKIETITLPDIEIKCTNSAQEETKNTHTETKTQPTNQPKKNFLSQLYLQSQELIWLLSSVKSMQLEEFHMFVNGMLHAW